jgi:hypothetical protein
MSAVSYQIGACIGKTGKQVHLTLADTTPINGVCSAARITGVGGNPTFYRNGKPVQIGKPRVYSATQDSPNFSYGIYCGGVKGFMIEDGGEGYSLATAVPSLDSSGSGGSGTVLGKLVVEQGVTSYRIDQPGGGFPLPPTATIVDLDGPGAGALCYVVVYEGGVTKVVVTDGGGGYVKPAIRFSGGTAAGVVVASGGVVTDVVMTDFGYGYPNPPVVTVGPPLNTSGPQGNIPANAYAIIYGADAASWNGKPGSVRAIVPFVGGLLGCGQGYVPASPPPVSVAVPAGATAPVVAAVVSGYVASLGVAQPGSDHNAMPDVVVAGGTRPAVLKPIMTGASPSDVFAADVPDGWITGLLGGQTVATSAVQSLSVVNSTGRFEPPIGGMPGFLAKPTMRVGGNHGAQPVSRYVNYQTFKNKLHVSYQMRVYFGAGTINYAPDNSPTDWTNPSGAVLGSLFYGPSTGNGVDNMGAASSVGQWTLVYDDAGVGTPNAAVANLISVYNSDKVTIKPVSLSGEREDVGQFHHVDFAGEHHAAEGVAGGGGLHRRRGASPRLCDVQRDRVGRRAHGDRRRRRRQFLVRADGLPLWDAGVGVGGLAPLQRVPRADDRSGHGSDRVVPHARVDRRPAEGRVDAGQSVGGRPRSQDGHRDAAAARPFQQLCRGRLGARRHPV